MRLNDDGLTMLAEAILKTAVSDYKYCWALKKLKNAGDYIFIWSKHKKRKKGEPKHILCTGSLSGLRGSVDDNIRGIENYIKYHPLVAHLEKEIIKTLRDEALKDEDLVRKVKSLKPTA